jgi:hypothetical protein
MSSGLPAFEGRSSAGGVNWLRTLIPEGPGLGALSMYLGGQSFLLSNLPHLNDNGSLQNAGFLSGLGFVTIPAGRGGDLTNFSTLPPTALSTDGINSPDPVIETIKATTELLATALQSRGTRGR